MHEKTVLLIEDDRDSRHVYGTVLRHAGYQVVEATDGGEGMLLAQRHRPDLIVMDLGLPRVDGWAATEAIKRDPATSHIPVIAITVHVQDFYRGRALAVGCDSFLDKPCSPTRLVGEVMRVLHEEV
jgi:two-component system, cell cycle response regulator DivK